MQHMILYQEQKTYTNPQSLSLGPKSSIIYMILFAILLIS